ncbi:hypothetical protein K450DRAFT_251929 [Umbelopsis ramanniana AG]|uniref:Uncharacterized protein n=1 Tax=Umbelopsis ramanniana AG TaxID=1314678 RepID=A0AAD5E500_UMBRA|nr:uncharacterized protein K450DRAFT_251929 [Umbelopsis ramanniana AG]KAI8577491.1 hypothetical protein K450DRAFT_251929 [Umbelopsis ramanniana AG]
MLQRSQQPKETFFDFPRSTIVREKPSVRLRKAVIDGNIHAVKRLLRKVNSIQNPDPDTGMTSLLLAAKHGKVDVVNYLLSVGHEDETISLDNEDNTVLMLAAINNEEEIFYRYAEKYPECIHAINKHGWSVLLFAAKNGNVNIVEFLLSISADVDHVDDDGNSALHHAAAWGHTHVITLLVLGGCNIDLENRQHFTASDYAYSFSVRVHLRELARMHLEDIAAIAPRQSLPFSTRSEASAGRPGPETIYRHRHSSSYESTLRSEYAPPYASSLPSAGVPLATSLSSSSSYLHTASIGSPQSQDAFGEYRGRPASSGDQATSPRLRGA